jgi:hypothetical protein
VPGVAIQSKQIVLAELDQRGVDGAGAYVPVERLDPPARPMSELALSYNVTRKNG